MAEDNITEAALEVLRFVNMEQIRFYAMKLFQTLQRYFSPVLLQSDQNWESSEFSLIAVDRSIENSINRFLMNSYESILHCHDVFFPCFHSHEKGRSDGSRIDLKNINSVTPRNTHIFQKDIFENNFDVDSAGNEMKPMPEILDDDVNQVKYSEYGLFHDIIEDLPSRLFTFSNEQRHKKNLWEHQWSLVCLIVRYFNQACCMDPSILRPCLSWILYEITQPQSESHPIPSYMFASAADFCTGGMENSAEIKFQEMINIESALLCVDFYKRIITYCEIHDNHCTTGVTLLAAVKDLTLYKHITSIEKPVHYKHLVALSLTSIMRPEKVLQKNAYNYNGRLWLRNSEYTIRARKLVKPLIMEFCDKSVLRACRMIEMSMTNAAIKIGRYHQMILKQIKAMQVSDNTQLYDVVIKRNSLPGCPEMIAYQFDLFDLLHLSEICDSDSEYVKKYNFFVSCEINRDCESQLLKRYINVIERSGSTYTESKDYKNFLMCAFCVMTRYKSLNSARLDRHGLQCAVPKKVMELLQNHLGVTHECFASPYNAYFDSYYSAFPDIDSAFGSLGSFFDDNVTLENGSYEANPPFDLKMMNAMVLKMITSLEKSTEPLSFSIFVPDWNNGGAQYYSDLMESPFLQATIILKMYKHIYISGSKCFQNNARDYSPSLPSRFFLLQNNAGSNLWRYTNSIGELIGNSFKVQQPKLWS